MKQDGNAPASKKRRTRRAGQPEASAPDAAARRERARTRREELNAELLTEMRALRSALREMMSRYELRVGGHIAELIQRIEGDLAIGAAPRPLPTRKAEAMLERIRARKLRPRKGRTKDFKRLETLVDELTDIAPDN